MPLSPGKRHRHTHRHTHTPTRTHTPTHTPTHTMTLTPTHTHTHRHTQRHSQRHSHRHTHRHTHTAHRTPHTTHHTTPHQGSRHQFISTRRVSITFVSRCDARRLFQALDEEIRRHLGHSLVVGSWSVKPNLNYHVDVWARDSSLSFLTWRSVSSLSSS